MGRRWAVAYVLAVGAVLTASAVRGALQQERGPVARPPGPPTATPNPTPDDGIPGPRRAPLARERSSFACLGDLLGQIGTDTSDQAPDVETQVELIAGSVETIRELEFSGPVEPQFLASEDMDRRIEALFLEDYTAEEADLERRILEALGAIPSGTDLRQLRLDALTGQVVGFYDPDTGELVVRQATGGGLLSGVEKITLAHELEHALADQRLDLPIEDETDPFESDADLAGLAVVEGDATLTMQRFGATLPVEDQLSLIADPSVLQAEADASGLPPYLRQELEFPYLQGLSFVCHRLDRGGWSAVNELYANPPTTTAQVLFPERYEAGETPADPPDPGPLPSPWERERIATVGAAHLSWLFAAPGGDRSRAIADPTGRAAAWAGGELHLWVRGRDTAVGLSFVERAEGLCDSVTGWYRASFPGAGERDGFFDGPQADAAVACAHNQVRLGIGPDPRTAGALVR